MLKLLAETAPTILATVITSYLTANTTIHEPITVEILCYGLNSLKTQPKSFHRNLFGENSRKKSLI